MGKYDDLIGGFKVEVDVVEVLNEAAANKVDDRIKQQKAELEKPIEINVKSNKAENQLKALHKAAQKVKDDLQDAISSQKGFEEVNKLVTKYGHLKKQIGDIAPVVGKNNATLKESNKILKDTKKLVDQLTVSQDKLNKTSGKTRTSKVNTIGSPKEIEQAFDAVEDKIKDVKDTYETFSEVVEKTKRSILGTDFDDIFHTRTVEGYAASLEKVRGKMSEIKDAARDARQEYEDIVNTMASYTGIQLGGKSDFQKAIKDAWKQGDHAMAAKLFDSYQKRFPKGAFKPENAFGAEWSNNFNKNLTEANARLALHRTQLQRTAEAYGTYSALMSLQGMERQLTDGYNRMLQERAEAEKAAAEQANALADAQKRFATNDVVTAQKNLNAAIDEYNAKLAESNRLLEEKRRIEDLDSYENEPWFNDYEFPVNKIMEISQQFAAAEDAANLFKIALKEAVRVYRELGGDMKLPLGADLLKEIDIPVKLNQEQLDKKLKDAKYMVSNQQAWIDYLDGSLNKDRFRTSGKREATDRLKTLTQSLISHRRNNYEDYNGQYAEEMMEVAWMHGYEEAQKQGVAQSTLDRYRVSDVEIFYKQHLSTLQEEYDRRKELLDKSTEELHVIEAQIAAQEKLSATVEKTAQTQSKAAEARLNLIAKKGVSGGYTAMDGKYDIGQDSEGWKVFQRDNAGLLNLIGTYKHFEDIKSDVSLLTREEIVRTDEVIQQIKILQEAYQSLCTETGGYMPLANKYVEVLDSVKNGAMSASDAIEQLNSTVGSAQPKQQDASSNDLVAKTNILAEFTQLSGQLAFQHVGTEQYDAIVGKIEEISNGILNTGMSLEDANKQLNEFIDGLTQAVQPSNKLTSSYEGLAEAVEQTVDAQEKLNNATVKYVPIMPKGRENIWGDTDDITIARNYIHNQDRGFNVGTRLSVVGAEEIQNAKELDAITRRYNESRQQTQDILNQEKLTFENIVYLLKEYNQMYWSKLSNPNLAADAVNLEADIENKLGAHTSFAWDDYLHTLWHTLEDPNRNDAAFDAYAKAIAKHLGVEAPGELKRLSIGEQLLELERLTGMSISKMLSSYDGLESGIKSKVNTILQSLGLMNEQLQFTFEKAHGGNAKAILGPDFVILQKTIEASTEFTGDLISKLHEAKQAGISVVPVLERVVSTLANQSNLDDNKFIPGYEIQQRGYGDILHAEPAVSSLNQALQENEVVLKASREQLTKFIEDWIALEKQGIQIDPSKGGNFLYSLEHGFSFIDLTLQQAKGKAKDLQTIFNEITSLLANTKGLNVFGRDNDLGLSAAEIINKVSSVFEQLGLATSNELRSWMVDRYDGIGNIHGQIDVKDLDKQPQIAQQTALQIEAQADAEQKVAEATQEQIKSAKERLAIERQVTAELEKHQDIAQQIMIADSDDLSYESPYSAEQIANFTNGTDINKILTRFGVPTDKKEPIIDQFNQWVSLIAEQRELESQGIESLEYDFSTMIDQAMSQLVDMIMKDGTTRQPIEKTLETFYEFIQDYKIKYSASDVSEFGSQWPAILRQFGTGKYGVLTQDKSAKSINDKWSELLEVFPQLFDSETINEKDQLIQFLDVVKAARAEHNNKSKTQPVDLPDYAKNNVMYDLSSTYGIISGNIEAMVSGLDRATSEQEKLSSVATITEQHLEGQSDAAKRFANTLSDIIDNEGVSKEIEKLFEPDVKNMIDNIRSAAQEGKVEFLQNILDSEELTTALTGAFSDAYNNIGDYKFKGKYPFEHDGLNKATIHLISKDESKTLDYVLKLEDGLLKIDKAKQKIGTTKFNIEHEVNSANAEVDKLVAKLNGRQLDGLDNLRTLANNIVDTESLAKFTDELDVISKKVATLSSKASSSKGFNPLTNSVYEMENASITVETYAKQLERLGDADGVSKAAEQLDNMASAAERFKNATNQTEEEGAFADYQQAKSKYKAYYEYAQESKKSAEAEAKQVNTEEQKIQQYYQSILNTVNKINVLDKEIEQAKGKNQTGAFSEFINKTQEEKAKLISDVKATLSEVAGLFGNGMIGQDVSIGGATFFSAEDTNNLNAFLQSAQVQTALAQGDVNKLSECLGQLSSAFANSEKIGAQASETIRSSLQKASEVGQKIFRFDELGNIAGSNGFNENIQLYDDALKSYQTLQLVMAQLSGKSETDWTAEEAAAVKLLSEEFVKLGTQIDAVKQKEDRFFSDKPVYSLDGLPSADLTSLGIDDVKKLGEVGSSTKEKLEGMAQAIAKNSNGAVVLTKSFTQGADGISKLDFSVFDQNTNSIRDFTAAMGAATNQFTVYETTIDKSVANIASARKQLNTAGDMLKTLGASGVDISADGAPAKVAQLISLMNQLEGAIEDGDQTMITKLTKDVKLAAGETDKLYKQMIQLDDAIASNKVQDLGKGDAGGNVYNQLVDATRNLVGTNQNATVEFGRFDAATNTLNASLVNANGTVENFKVSMNGLNGQMTAQQSGVSKLTSTWDTFKASISKAGKQLMTAFVGYNVFYKAISEVRKGVGYVKEIDLALTELKKVTDETEESYRQFLNTAASTAGKIGSTVSDFTEATSNFARLGYTMEESANMAETAIVYRNVADGLDTVEEATDSIISTMKAFGIESNNTMGIVDRFNEVGNNFAITSAGIGEALQRSASALYAGGNTIDEAIGLVTASNSVIQNPEQVGTALKTLSLRLRGAKVELEEAGLETDSMAESTSTLQAKLEALTHGKVDIMINADTFKSTTQILREMSQAWEDMTDIERAAALELMGGKRQSNILSSLISNFETVEDVIETSMNSSGKLHCLYVQKCA